MEKLLQSSSITDEGALKPLKARFLLLGTEGEQL
jgi:hypothetical protein